MNLNIEQQILSILYEKRRLSYRELAIALGLSIPTVRKKTSGLISKSLLKSVYGGVEYYSEESKQDKEIFAIALEAVKLINEGDTIYLGPGKTVAALCPHISAYKQLTVFTNSLPILENLADMPNITLFSIGGMYQHSNKSFSLFHNHLINININKAFISATAIDPELGIAHRIPENKETVETISANAKKIIFIGSKDKFDVHGPFMVMPINALDTIVSSQGLNHHIIEKLKCRNINVVLASY
ncbi:MAG: DeoR/GlpR family DNA-binding transcription regulator [Brevinema sp.]